MKSQKRETFKILKRKLSILVLGLSLPYSAEAGLELKTKIDYRFENDATESEINLAAGLINGSIKVLKYSDGTLSYSWHNYENYNLNKGYNHLLSEADTNSDGTISRRESINFFDKCLDKILIH